MNSALLQRVTKHELPSWVDEMLAEQLHLEKSTVSRLIQHLEQRGWVKRVRDLHDTRMFLLHLSDGGTSKPCVWPGVSQSDSSACWQSSSRMNRRLWRMDSLRWFVLSALSESHLLVRRVLFGQFSPVIHGLDDFAKRFPRWVDAYSTWSG
jgi:hypothetical protein